MEGERKVERKSIIRLWKNNLDNDLLVSYFLFKKKTILSKININQYNISYRYLYMQSPFPTVIWFIKWNLILFYRYVYPFIYIDDKKFHILYSAKKVRPCTLIRILFIRTRLILLIYIMKKKFLKQKKRNIHCI